MIVHLGEVLIHLLVIFVIVKGLKLHLELALLSSESLELLHRVLELLLQAVPLEDHVLQVELWLDDAGCGQAVVRQVHKVGRQRIAARLLQLDLLLYDLFFTLLLYQQVLHVVDERATGLLLGNLEGEALQLREEAFAHVHGVLVGLEQGLETSNSV